MGTSKRGTGPPFRSIGAPIRPFRLTVGSGTFTLHTLNLGDTRRELLGNMGNLWAPLVEAEKEGAVVLQLGGHPALALYLCRLPVPSLLVGGYPLLLGLLECTRYTSVKMDHS